MKRAVRQVKYSSDGSLVYSISKNKALCVYDVQSNKRIRCIRESHDDIPYSMSLLPSSSVKGQQIATADESGEIRTWDMRSPQPIICTFHEQEEVINALETHGHMLLAASSDGTLGSYELRRRKLFLRSESMGNELLSIGITNGYLDIFKVNEYGNLLERIKCNHSLGIDCMQVLRTNVILTASNEDDIHLNPNKKLGAVGNFYGGIQQLAISANKDWLVSLGFMKSKIKFWDLGQILSNVHF
ncbi:unnamed protein product [Dracunculus medinensis]|uniref:Uncharacterized protein n=1 Tax=Dracunculus medinensis TaxID=318479 RepID=A0A3P7QRG2_DRAME|nr:unnamed protein product [Dracunculus medinensis]